jgi:hypothetical protein
MYRASLYIVVSILAIILPNHIIMKQKSKPESKIAPTEWIINSLKETMPGKIKISGNPGTVKYKYGEAVSFNGSSDGILIENMPLAKLEHYTIELIFQPQSGGNFEQRFFHCGEVQSDRVLLELRATPAGWYSDAFIKTGDDQLALIDPALIHTFDSWYHLAYINDNGKFSIYINGKKELEGLLKAATLKSGNTSLGMRQNEVSWFKGAIYKIRISAAALDPNDFLKF